MIDTIGGRLLSLFALVGTSLALAACGDDLCEDANDVCAAIESDLTFERDCPDEPTECLASCIVDAEDCSADTLARCDDICGPFIEG